MARQRLSKASSLQVALFVEGSDPPDNLTRSSLRQIWNEHLAGALGLSSFSGVYPISKKHLLAMDPDTPPMSGAGEALDQYMTRMHRRAPFDAAVIAWDLIPEWNREAGVCRWQETLDLYRLLASSKDLDAPWRERARGRWRELTGRPTPSARRRPPVLGRHEILALCMDPVFESLLCVDEAGVRRALGLAGKNVREWPSGWKKVDVRRPDDALLQPAVDAARGERTSATRAVRGAWDTSKNEWGEFLLRSLLADPQCAPKLIEHPICRRLAEIGPR